MRNSWKYRVLSLLHVFSTCCIFFQLHVTSNSCSARLVLFMLRIACFVNGGYTFFLVSDSDIQHYVCCLSVLLQVSRGCQVCHHVIATHPSPTAYSIALSYSLCWYAWVQFFKHFFFN